MSTLQQLRDRVRTQLDLDSEDLPDTTLDGYLREGFDRTFALEQRWPFFEQSWALTLPEGDTTIALPTSPEVAAVVRLRSGDTGYDLLHVTHQLAEDNFQGITATATNPDIFSIWASTIYLWPEPTAAERSYTLRGYRKPSWTGVAADELDGDDTLHASIGHYAISLAYAQLEDAELEDVYMRRWSATAQAAQKIIMRPWHERPLILNSGFAVPFRRRLYLDV